LWSKRENVSVEYSCYELQFHTKKSLKFAVKVTETAASGSILRSAFECARSPLNAEPNLVFTFRHLLTLTADRASGSGSVQVRTDFRTEPCHHYETVTEEGTERKCSGPSPKYGADLLYKFGDRRVLCKHEKEVCAKHDYKKT
jgi:hypothetical protein